MWIKDKILWECTEKSDFRRGVMKKPIYRVGDCLKRGLKQFPDLIGCLGKKRGMVFLRGVPRHVTRGGGGRKRSPLLIFDFGNIGQISDVKC